MWPRILARYVQPRMGRASCNAIKSIAMRTRLLIHYVRATLIMLGGYGGLALVLVLMR